MSPDVPRARQDDRPELQRPRLLGYLRPGLVLAAVVSATIVVSLTYAYYGTSRSAEDAARTSVVQRTSEAAVTLDELATGLQCEAVRVAAMLSGTPDLACAAGPVAELPPPDDDPRSGEACSSTSNPVEDRAEACVRQIVSHHPEIFGGSVSYVPGGYRGAAPGELRAMYYHKPGGIGGVVESPLAYDYTVGDEYTWFTKPIEEGNGWTAPYFDEAANVLMVTFSAVFNELGALDRPRGVVTLDISSDQLRRVMQGLDLGPSGYGALTSPEGRYMYHPNREFIDRERTIEDVANERNDEDRRTMWADIELGRSGIIDHVSTTTGEESWLVYEAIPSAGWSLQNTFIKSDIAIDVDSLRRQAIMATAASTILLGSVLALLLGGALFDERTLWQLSIGVSLGLASAIWFIWRLALVHPPADAGSLHAVAADDATAEVRQGTGGGRCLAGMSSILVRGDAPVRITQQESLNRVKEAYRSQALCRGSRRPIFVDVGVSVETLKFLGENEIGVGGQMWGRIPAGAPASLRPGFSLANATGMTMKLLGEETTQAGDRIARWTFEATVAQLRTSVRYPIEQEAVGIEIRPIEPIIDDDTGTFRVYLMPHLAAYDLTNPTARPGLDHDLSVPGWRPLRSSFHLGPPEGRSSLGIDDPAGEVIPPELVFDVVLERDFADAFISNLTPIIVVAVMLFAVLMVSNKLDYGRALSICVGMFFVIVFSHIDLRQRLAAQTIFYLEYFYFTIYVGILWVSFTCLLQAFDHKFAAIENRNRLVPKITYWPGLLGTILICTIFTFY